MQRKAYSVNFCPLCRGDLRPRDVDGKERLRCQTTACRFVYWNNPVPVVAGLVSLDDRFVLARNSQWPKDIYSLLTGFLESGEAPENAIVREVREELGVNAHSPKLIGHFAVSELNQLIIAFELKATGPLDLGQEISDVKLFSLDELAEYDFGPLVATRAIVSKWLDELRRGCA